jgi:hypothetical protein
MLYNIGDLITFTYPAVFLQGTRAHDKFPRVLVLHSGWEGLVHGLNFNYLTADEINTIRMILDPSFEVKYRDALNKQNSKLIIEFDNIMRGAANANIVSPRDFYTRVVKPFIISRGWDPYRLYTPSKMTAVRVVQRRQHLEGQPMGVFQGFVQKFQSMKGPTMPRFKKPWEKTAAGSTAPGALPGTRKKK